MRFPIQTSPASAALLAVATATTPSTAHAQGPAAGFTPSITIYGHGGGLSPLTDVGEVGDTKFKTGFTAGGGVGWQFHPLVGVRGDFNYGEERMNQGAAQFADEKFTKLYYGGEVVLRYPTASGVTPYLGVGAGGVTIESKDEGVLDRFTKLAGRASLGLNYAIANSAFGVFGQATGWLYHWDRAGFDKNQLDLQYTAGISYHLPL